MKCEQHKRNLDLQRETPFYCDLGKRFEFWWNSVIVKEVNIVPKAISVWPVVRYILDTSQYRYTISGLSLLFYIYIYTHIHTYLIIYLDLFINL